jgi:uncharacterized membrane protein
MLMEMLARINWRFNWRDYTIPLSSLWPWLVAAVFCSGVIHVLAVMSIPYLATRDAWARLSEISKPNQMYLMPVAQKEPPLPFMAPDVAYAFCRFDLTQNNVQVQTQIGDASWSIAVSGRYGENFYFISGAEAKRRELHLLLVPRARLAEEASNEQSEQGDEQIIVITPGLTGVVMVQAPLRGPSFAADTLNAMRNAGCAPVVAPEPVPVALERTPDEAADAKPARQQRSRRRRSHRDGQFPN